MPKPIRTRFALCLLLFFSPGVTPWAVGQDVPFTAEVVDQSVPVRAGAGRSFYEVGRLTGGSQVVVDEVVFGWFKVHPPQGTYSYISQAFVDATGNGQTGTINTDRAAVRTASVNGSAESYRRQIDLLKGDRVTIVGQDGDFYKIEPPNGAYVFLPPGSIRPVGDDTEPVADQQPPHTPSQPEQAVSTSIAPASADPSGLPTGFSRTAEPETDDDASNQDPGDRVVSVDKPSLATANADPVISATLRAAEQRLIASEALSLEERPLGELFETYRSLARNRQLSLVDGRIIAMRIAQLQRHIDVIKTLQTIAEAQRAHQETRLFADQLPPELPKQRYDVRGRLLASSVYNGKNLPRLYRITESDGHRIIAYVRLRPALNPVPLLGEYVGVMGQTRFDPMLKLEILDAEHIDVISSTVSR